MLFFFADTEGHEKNSLLTVSELLASGFGEEVGTCGMVLRWTYLKGGVVFHPEGYRYRCMGTSLDEDTFFLRSVLEEGVIGLIHEDFARKAEQVFHLESYKDGYFRVKGEKNLDYHLKNLSSRLVEDKLVSIRVISAHRYDKGVQAMIGLLKYGSGMPFNRLQGLERDLGIPLPATTQWEIVSKAADELTPAYREMVREAADGDVVHNDDTKAKILAHMGKRKAAALEGRARAAANGCLPDIPPAERTGIFTSGIVSRLTDRKIALFFTGLKHAGENIQALLASRERARRPPIQMCDALSRNLPRNLKTILANCLAHGRRQFVELVNNFPKNVS